VWQTIKDYHKDTKSRELTGDHRNVIEQNMDIHPFDGGVFIAIGNEFDLFVVPEKRGRWRIRTEIGNYLHQMGKSHSTIVVRINENNSPSLRLAEHFGFKKVSRENGIIRLEKRNG
jgi:hypothetical protein